MRRSTVLVLAALALVLAACQIRTDYGLLIESDTSAELAFEISYDSEAAELLGPAQGFLEEEIEDGISSTLEGVTLVDATADSSDPERQRVTAVFAAEDGAALDRLVEELFPGSSFTNVSGTTWQLTLRTDDDVAADFGEDFPLGDIAGEFLAGEVRVGYAGSQVSMQGGTDDGRNEVVWNPYGGEDLDLVLDLSGSGAAPAPEDPAPDEPADAEEGAPDEDAADEEAATDDPAVDDDEDDEPAAEQEDAQEEAAVVTIDDGGGLSILLLAAIAGGALLLLLILLLVLRGRRRNRSEAEQPVAVGTDQAGWAPPAPAAPQQSWGGPPPSSTAPTQQLPPSGPAGSQPPPGPGAPPPPPPPPGNLPPPPAG